MDETGEVRKCERFGTIPKEREWQVVTLLEFTYVNGISICVHHDVFNKIGVFREEFRYAQDYDFYLRAFSHFAATHIPVDTCVMRSHVAQYSVTQTTPMFFQAAQAAIEFLNAHTMAEMFPLVDLAQPVSAAAAVDRALDVAMSAHCLLYKLGAHPALFSRIIAWVSTCPRNGQWRLLRNNLRTRFRAGSFLHNGTPIGLMCKAAWVMYNLADKPRYMTIDPVEVARGLYPEMLQSSTDRARSLSEYVSGHLDAECSKDVPMLGKKQSALIALCEPTEQELDGCGDLVQSGMNVMVIADCGRGLAMRYGAVIVSCKMTFRAVLSLLSIPIFDVALANESVKYCRWPLARTSPVVITHGCMIGDAGMRGNGAVGVVARSLQRFLGAVARVERIVRRCAV